MQFNQIREEAGHTRTDSHSTTAIREHVTLDTHKKGDEGKGKCEHRKQPNLEINYICLI